MRNFCLLFLVFTLSFSGFSQQLMINEVSQGAGSSEYVEFVVIGSPICEGQNVPCIDLRKVIIDDNNGFFAPGAGTGVATGALRFSNDAFWSCVPQGTFIVVYNEASPNTSLPADDLSLTDGNCTLIIPGDSPLLESTTLSPNTGDPLYPTLDSDWIPSSGWAVASMNNNNDSFQIPNLGVNGTPLHSVSWGNNTSGAIIFFTGPVSNQVISFKNTVDNNFNSQQNWVMEDVSTGQTPGVANNISNDLWIGTMNPNCRVNPALSFAVTNSDCNASNGSITLTVANSSNVDILWETGATTATISNLATGTYSVTVTDNSTGCVFSDSAVVALNNSTLAANPTITHESCTNLCDGSVQLNISGGQSPYSEAWFQNSVAIAKPSDFCAGTYEVKISDANNCELIKSIQINTTTVVNYTISNDTIICAGDAIQLEVVGGSSVVWSTGVSANTITVNPSQNTTFTATITQNTCVISDAVTVAISNCNLNVTFPNIFTPDGDKVNDSYVPIAFSGVINQEFTIFNRWGNIMYQSTDQQISWDGKVDGKEAMDGVYFYVCKYIEENASEVKTAQGFIQLKRK